jgi:hypothetical protein
MKNRKSGEKNMNCKRCHREIKNPKSVQQGYGPTCLRKIQAATRLKIGTTSTEKSVVPIFEKMRKNNVDVTCLEHLDGTDANGKTTNDENKAQTWTDMYGIIHILRESEE